MNDVRKLIFRTIAGFFLLLAFWLSIVYISSCGFTFTCGRGDAIPERTPIPTLIPSSHSETIMNAGVSNTVKCQIRAIDLVGVWVNAGSSETDPFSFTDPNGQSCEGTFSEDIQHLFVDNSLWYPGSLGCVSCHNASADERNGGLDMTSLDAINKSGVLSGGNWEQSRMFEILSIGTSPQGHSSESIFGNPMLYAGVPVADEQETASP